MFKAYWDIRNNIPVLSNSVVEIDTIPPPRPVYFEELDTLGFDSFWDYPKSQYPLLWAIGRSYFYNGIEVAQVNGGNMETDPQINLIHSGKLEPVSISTLVDKNRSKLTILENEAKQFISKVYAENKGSANIAVAFSGGKDSQVILDLVSQVIPPDEYIVIYTDTGMELPDNRYFVQTVFNEFSKKFINFRYAIADQITNIMDNWKHFGPPSRLHRWCCTVAKSVPFYVKLSQFTEDNKTIVFEGVRREESFSRSGYDRVATSVKHELVVNSRPIISWNDTEVYIYLLSKGIDLNPAYRKGLTRVGCSICPFSSDWSELMICKNYPSINDQFIGEIKKVFESNGIHDTQKQIQYLSNGKWKMRGGEKNLPDNESRISFSCIKGEKCATIINAKSILLSWVRIFSHHIIYQETGKYTLVLHVRNEYAKYDIEENGEKTRIVFYNSNPLSINRDFTKLLMKVTYCIGCHTCFVECPTKAISFTPSIRIDEQKCIHCLQCINAIQKGCLIASSRSVTFGEKDMNSNNTNIDRYSTFGLREEWLKVLIHNSSDWERDLGTKQISALKRWFVETELLTNKFEESELLKTIQSILLEDIWGIVWTNLAYNSGVVSWYHTIPYQHWNRGNLFQLLKSDFPAYSEGTLNNAFGALLNLLDCSTIIAEQYGQGILTKKGKAVTEVFKRTNNRVSSAVILYCLYKHAQTYEGFNTTVTELYLENSKQTPAKLFGVDKGTLMKILLGLQEHRSRLVRVEFNANLDNIFLNKDHTAYSAIKTYLEG